MLIDTANNHASLNAVEKFAGWMMPTLLKLYPYETLHKTLLKQSGEAAAITPSALRNVTYAMRVMSKDDIVRVMTGMVGVLRDDPSICFNKPIFMACGDHSNASSIKKQMPAWAEHEPQAVYVVIPSAGHCCNLDNPAAFNAELITFLQKALSMEAT